MTNLLRELNDCNSAEKLEAYISLNISDIYDKFININFLEITASREAIDTYLSRNLRTITSIDLSENNNLAFLSILLDVSERCEFTFQFQRLYNALNSRNYNLGARLEAAALFLIGIRTIGDYQSVLDDLISKLDIAFSNEEDTEYKVVCTFVNYYAQIVHNFARNSYVKVCEIRDVIKRKSQQEDIIFLQNKVILEILQLDITNNEAAFNAIQNHLDVYSKQFRQIYVANDTQNLLEQDTDYSDELDTAAANFHAIRQISVNKYRALNDASVFHSLQRGVKILSEEKQLFSYMNSYGLMHYKKLKTAFEYLPSGFFSESINIIDWGCGQAMATMVYLEHLQSKNIEQSIHQIKLIEPSEIAIKRGSLHIKKFDERVEIITINKDLDSLKNRDLSQNDLHLNLHLFSNIIDIDFFSLHQLLEKIETNFKGVNYFVCVSPYITNMKTNRIDNFVSYFDKFETTNIKTIDNQKGEWEVSNDWTRVVRIFRTNII